jgi:hypothetical protein
VLAATEVSWDARVTVDALRVVVLAATAVSSVARFPAMVVVAAATRENWDATVDRFTSAVLTGPPVKYPAEIW